MLTSRDLRAAHAALLAQVADHEEAADRYRRTDPHDAHEEEDRASEAKAVAGRVAAAAEVADAYEAQLAIAAAERDSEACHECGARPLYDEHLKLCAACAPGSEAEERAQ